MLGDNVTNVISLECFMSPLGEVKDKESCNVEEMHLGPKAENGLGSLKMPWLL